jgi:hypothetical protein
MRVRCGWVVGVWVLVLGLAVLTGMSLTAWLEPAYALAWVQLMALCR